MGCNEDGGIHFMKMFKTFTTSDQSGYSKGKKLMYLNDSTWETASQVLAIN